MDGLRGLETEDDFKELASGELSLLSSYNVTVFAWAPEDIFVKLGCAGHKTSLGGEPGGKDRVGIASICLASRQGWNGAASRARWLGICHLCCPTAWMTLVVRRCPGTIRVLVSSIRLPRLCRRRLTGSFGIASVFVAMRSFSDGLENS